MKVGLDISAVSLNRAKTGLYNHIHHLAQALHAHQPERYTLYCRRQDLGWARDAFPGLAVRGVRPPPRFYRLWRRFAAFDRSDVYLHNLDSLWGPITGGANVYLVPDVIPLAIDYTKYVPWLTKAGREYYEQAVRHADEIVVSSAHSKQDLLARVGGSADRVTVVPLAAGPEYRPADPPTVAAALEKYGLAGTPYILTVGSVELRKNQTTLIRAFARLLARDPGLPHRLVLVGGKGAGHEETVAEMERQPAADRITWLGFADDLPALYTGAAAFAFPSRYEGFGLPPLEAMACGTPVVCSDATCLPEVVGDAALMFGPDDVDALTDQLHRVLTDAAVRADYSRRSLARAGQFSWAKTAAGYADVLRAAARTRLPAAG